MFDLLRGSCTLEVKQSELSNLSLVNLDHVCHVLVNDSDKSALFSLHGSVYMKM